MIRVNLTFFIEFFLIKSHSSANINSTIFRETEENDSPKTMQVHLDRPLRYVAHASPQYSETFGPPFRHPILSPPLPRSARDLVTIPIPTIPSSCLLPVKDAFCQPQTRETGLYGDRGTLTPSDRRNRAQDTESREA